MSREWKPGDVARTIAGGTIARTAQNRWVLLDDGHPIDWEDDSRIARPLVVIDAEDREQVERLARAYVRTFATFAPDQRTVEICADQMQAALREFADPKPVEVFEHYVASAPADGPVRSLCGKVWTPDERAVSVGRCPDCTAIVESGWVK